MADVSNVINSAVGTGRGRAVANRTFFQFVSVSFFFGLFDLIK